MRAIRKVRIAHCKRGPDECEICRQWDAEEFCLLELTPPGYSLGQARLVKVEAGVCAGWWEFEVVTRFSGEEDARAHAAREGIEVIE